MCNNESQVITGVDLGISNLVVTSEGKVYENIRILKSKMRLLRIRQKSLSRKVKGSNNRRKQKLIVAKLHYKI